MVDEELREILINQERSPGSNKSDSSEDDDRLEMKWTNKQENYIDEVKRLCEQKSKMYDIASHKCKRKYNFYSLPTIVIPLLLSVVNPYISNQYEIIQSSGMALVSILTGLNTFYNYGKKCERYNEYASKYDEIVNDIDLEMSKPKRYRTACDVYLERVKIRKNQTDNSAPFI